MGVGTAVASSRRRNRCSGRWLCALASILCLNWSFQALARSVPQLADYCPPEPATGQLVFKSVDSASATCTPGPGDPIGLAVFECWQEFVIKINGCQVSICTAEDHYMGPGRLPCRLLGLSGNLTGEGVEAQMWADVDGLGLLSYYYRDPEAVKALQFEDSRELVRSLWDFMLGFTGDLRFADTAWIDEASFNQLSGPGAVDATELASRSRSSHAAETDQVHSHDDSPSDRFYQLQDLDMEDTEELDSAQTSRRRRRRQLHAAAAAAGASAGSKDGVHVGMAMEPVSRRGRHGAMRLYRTSETRVVVKVPDTGCKYRYTVNSDSHVFESPARHHAHVEWHTILLAAAFLSVVLSVVGLGACTYFSHKHAEYVASYWEYQAVKDQLGSELPASTYVRLFGEEPKTAVPAAATPAAVNAATATAVAAPLAAATAAAAAAAAGTYEPPAAAETPASS